METETCPECKATHVAGDVRGMPCFACSVAANVREKGGTEEAVQEARDAALKVMFLELCQAEDPSCPGFPG